MCTPGDLVWSGGGGGGGGSEGGAAARTHSTRGVQRLRRGVPRSPPAASRHPSCAAPRDQHRGGHPLGLPLVHSGLLWQRVCAARAREPAAVVRGARRARAARKGGRGSGAAHGWCVGAADMRGGGGVEASTCTPYAPAGCACLEEAPPPSATPPLQQQPAACLPNLAWSPPHPPASGTQNCEMRTVVLTDGGGAGVPDQTWFRGGEGGWEDTQQRGAGQRRREAPHVRACLALAATPRLPASLPAWRTERTRSRNTPAAEQSATPCHPCSVCGASEGPAAQREGEGPGLAAVGAAPGALRRRQRRQGVTRGDGPLPAALPSLQPWLDHSCDRVMLTQSLHTRGVRLAWRVMCWAQGGGRRRRRRQGNAGCAAGQGERGLCCLAVKTGRGGAAGWKMGGAPNREAQSSVQQQQRLDRASE